MFPDNEPFWSIPGSPTWRNMGKPIDWHLQEDVVHSRLVVLPLMLQFFFHLSAALSKERTSDAGHEGDI